MVASFREQVRQYIVPLVSKLYERQAKRIGVEELKFYDEGLEFLSGNAKPKGDADWIVANGKKMYEELSPETAEFFNYMLDRGLMDLVAKKGRNQADIVLLLKTTIRHLSSRISMVHQAISMY